MDTDVDRCEEEAALARERLRRNLAGFGRRYSLVAIKEVGRQLGQGRGRGAMRSSADILKASPFASGLLIVSAGRLLLAEYRSRVAGQPADSDSLPDGAKGEAGVESTQARSGADDSAARGTIQWAREHPLLSGTTSIAAVLIAGVVIINGGRRRE